MVRINLTIEPSVLDLIDDVAQAHDRDESLGGSPTRKEAPSLA